MLQARYAPEIDCRQRVGWATQQDYSHLGMSVNVSDIPYFTTSSVSPTLIRLSRNVKCGKHCYCAYSPR